jgi:hypothetical protein
MDLPETTLGLDSPTLAETLSREIASLPDGSLPLAGEQGGRIDPDSIGVMLLSRASEAERVELVIGVFFTEIVGGCSCGEEPFSSPGYRELRLRIDRASGAAVWVSE